MILTFKPAVPILDSVKKIVKGLEEAGITATYEFIAVVPRHYLIALEVSDDETPQSLLELGALIGALDSYSIR